MLSIQDIRTRPRTVYSGANVDGLAGGPCRIFRMSVTFGSFGDYSVTVNNAASSGSGETIVLKGEGTGNGPRMVRFDFGRTGIRFDTDLSVVSAGTGKTYSVEYMVE